NARAMVRNKARPNEYDPVNEEFTYDGAGRVTGTGLWYSFLQGDIGVQRYITETVRSYDANSNVIQTTNYERTDSSTKNENLSGFWLESDSRRTYTATWFDAVNRVTSRVDYGRNGGVTFTRPG